MPEASAQTFATAPEPAPAVAGGYLDVGPHQLGYTRSGSGPDLVFIHGWPLHSATFRNVAPQLSNEYTCHLIDLPAAGRSRSAAGAPTSFRDQIGVLNGAIAALGLERYAFVAHDSGGMLARYVAAGDPRVAALVLGNTELPGSQPMSITLLSVLAQVPGGAELLRAAMRNPSYRRSGRGFGPCLESRAFLEGEFDRLFLEPIFASSAATRRALSALPSYRGLCAALSDVHARIAAPSLLVWGDADTFFPLSGARAMLSQFAAGAQLELIAGGKLFVHEEHPDEFVRLARPFLARQLR